jgi:hypothetical protein
MSAPQKDIENKSVDPGEDKATATSRRAKSSEAPEQTEPETMKVVLSHFHTEDGEDYEPLDEVEVPTARARQLVRGGIGTFPE